MPKLIGDFDERLKSLHVSVGSFLRVLKPVAFSRIESASTLGNGKLKLGELLEINGDDDDDGGGKVETID